MDDLSRTLMTLRCRDCDGIPKVPRAGHIEYVDGQAVQVMHNGVQVVAGGYHGDWMAQIIRGLRGHHEPQEELLFHHLLRFVRHKSLIVELGSFWSYYTIWYLTEVPGSRAICIEPDPIHMVTGEKNAALNGVQSRIAFVPGWVGSSADGYLSLQCETSKERRTLPCFDMPKIESLASGAVVELLHVDAQGAEFDLIRTMAEPVRNGQIRFLVVSTHHRAISGSATTHEDCLRELKRIGGIVLAEHDVQSSFSGDGLIVASFFEQDRALELPAISRNEPERSLFPKP